MRVAKMNSARTDEELARIDELVVISCRLPDVTDYRALRLYIDLELVLLLRRVSDLLASEEAALETDLVGRTWGVA